MLDLLVVMMDLLEHSRRILIFHRCLLGYACSDDSSRKAQLPSTEDMKTSCVDIMWPPNRLGEKCIRKWEIRVGRLDKTRKNITRERR